MANAELKTFAFTSSSPPDSIKPSHTMYSKSRSTLSALASILAVVSLTKTEVQAVVSAGAVTSGSGSFIIIAPPLPSSPPNQVGNDTFQNTNLYAFNEDQNVPVAGSPLAVDYKPGGGTGTIPVGTTVSSHYVFFDPRDDSSQRGWVDFDAPILGVISSTGNLLASDYLANTGVTYLNPAARGLEPGDSAIIDPSNPNRLLVDWFASTPGDYVRVLTQRSPGAAPDTGSTVLLLGASLGLMRWLRAKVSNK